MYVWLLVIDHLCFNENNYPPTFVFTVVSSLKFDYSYILFSCNQCEVTYIRRFVYMMQKEKINQLYNMSKHSYDEYIRLGLKVSRSCVYYLESRKFQVLTFHIPRPWTPRCILYSSFRSWQLLCFLWKNKWVL